MVSEKDVVGLKLTETGLNPCSNGTWSRRRPRVCVRALYAVLILVLMEHGLGVTTIDDKAASIGLNPCSNGTWSRSIYLR